MECVGAMFDGEWSALNAMYSTEEADFMEHLLGNCSNEMQINSYFGLSAFCAGHQNEGPSYSSDDTSTTADIYSFSLGSSSCSFTTTLPVSSAHQYYTPATPIFASNLIVDGDQFLNQDLSNDTSMESAEAVPEGKTLMQLPVPETPAFEDKEDSLSKKRPRIPLNVNNKRNVKPKKNEKRKSADDHKNDESCPSEDDSNASQELNGGSKAPAALNSNGKTRASRGSATDPQSLYARKRRERINERLRILQNLVPNGTKVDISTMLEEAVQYVKFLQLQIKLLSSDDMWMYAPIAYNGMNIGLGLKIDTPKSS